ncbi:exported hypothetical protein [Paraburkholderia unamae]|uniref:hypothetical protein n=1 Tax=Paraburkholderia unamae TaxID=219649 RepID=UPI001CAF958D|nr:hypothetical protein [Paraburkholderia unamae]CAG9244348.1 exported hypothetical protein [Paraburkholderia unamae]
MKLKAVFLAALAMTLAGTAMANEYDHHHHHHQERERHDSRDVNHHDGAPRVNDGHYTNTDHR